MNLLQALLVLVSSLLILSKSQFQSDKRVVCYYTDWRQQWNISFRLQPRNIDATLCTHVVYAFAMPDLNEGIVPTNFLRTLVEGVGKDFVNLKQRNPNLKLLISLGGWPLGWIQFSRIAADPERRRWFAEYTCRFVRDYNFDGLDINWQWPGQREGSNSLDRENYAALIKEFKQYFQYEARLTNREPLLLTVVLPQLKEVVDRGYDMTEVLKYVDFLNVNSFDYHMSTEPWVDHPGPLYSIPMKYFNPKLTVSNTIQQYLDMGIDPKLLNLGISTYGRSYILESPLQTGLGSRSDDEGIAGFATTTPGVLAYFEICRHIKEDGWQVEHPNTTAMGPYAFHDSNWVAYDDEDIVRRKARYAIQKGLGGIMIWTIDLDDFKGFCYDPFPLLKAANEIMMAPVPAAAPSSSLANTLSIGGIEPPRSPSAAPQRPPNVQPQPDPQTFNQPQPSTPFQSPPSSSIQPERPTFGQPVPPTFGQPIPPTFGQPEPPTFGQPEPPTFGQPQPSTFAQPQPAIRPQPSTSSQPQSTSFQAPQSSTFSNAIGINGNRLPGQPGVSTNSITPSFLQPNTINFKQPNSLTNPFMSNNRNYKFKTNQSFAYRNIKFKFNKNCYTNC